MNCQIKVIDNNREDNVKTEVGVKKENNKVIDNISYFCNGGEFKNLISRIFKHRLIDRELHLTSFDN